MSQKIRQSILRMGLSWAVLSSPACTAHTVSTEVKPEPKPKPLQATMLNSQDPHSYARPEEAVVTHMDLDLKVDFGSKQISGRASLRIQAREDAKELRLDTRGLEILQVTTGAKETPTHFELGAADPVLGQP
ncbi:MAG: hypothetical protein R3C68_03345 [Myxococcota bacterium]